MSVWFAALVREAHWELPVLPSVLSGGILNLLWGVTSGGLLGAQAGKLIDENVIGLYHCPKCHLRFKA